MNNRFSMPNGNGLDEAQAAARSVGQALRERRTASGVTMRQLADRVGVSTSLVSQIETGKVNPSVGTLVSLVTALGLSLDELFFDAEAPAAAGPPPDAPRPDGPGPSRVVQPNERPRIDLATGVTWNLLTPSHEQGVDFLYVVYAVGGASCPPDALMRHHGREYGLVLSGRLGATVGFENHELGPGSSIVFNADTPHRLWTIGDEPATAVWTIIGRDGDQREPFSE